MKLFFSEAQLSHDPRQLMAVGRLVAPLDGPDRARTMAQGLAAIGLTASAPDDHGLAPTPIRA